MRFVILAHNLRSAGGLSVGRNIAATLRRVADQHEFCLTLPAGVGYESVDVPSRSELHYLPRWLGSMSQIWFEFAKLPGIIRRFRPDMLWGLGNFVPPKARCPQALLCHQPYFVYDPADQPRRVWYRRPEVRMTLVRFRRGLPQTHMVFCQTNTMVERFRKAFDFRGEMAVFPNAVSRFAVEGSPACPTALAPLADRFPLLCLTKYYIHKNLHALVDLFERHGAALADVVVVLTLRPDDDEAAPAFLRRVAKSRARGHFLNVGRVAQAELPGYFRHCRALLMPSVLESFSATYIEAMQFGTPILASDMDFAREICGDAALYFDPWRIEAIRDAILRLKNEPALGPELVRRGNDRKQLFFRGWDEIVADAVSRLERLAGAARKS
ncbi:MAG: glycosyltransferase [Planctomycetes bacterium]|nr:glycosyltransferase [Planctomycetota bacterium]